MLRAKRTTAPSSSHKRAVRVVSFTVPARSNARIVTYSNESSETTPDSTTPLPLIVRATNSKSKINRDKKVKLSTIVEADALEGFFVRYAEVCKAGMSGLKKRDRSKAKEKLKAKKKKLGTAATEVKKA